MLPPRCAFTVCSRQELNLPSSPVSAASGGFFTTSTTWEAPLHKRLMIIVHKVAISTISLCHKHRSPAPAISQKSFYFLLKPSLILSLHGLGIAQFFNLCLLMSNYIVFSLTDHTLVDFLICRFWSGSVCRVIIAEILNGHYYLTYFASEEEKEQRS